MQALYVTAAVLGDNHTYMYISALYTNDFQGRLQFSGTYFSRSLPIRFIFYVSSSFVNVRCPCPHHFIDAEGNKVILQAFTLHGCYTMYGTSSSPMFRDSQLVPEK
jgi:hypothetical protein